MDGFSNKEILIAIDGKLDKFIDKVENTNRSFDTRIDKLEQHKEGMTFGVKTLAWVVGSSGLITGLIFLFKTLTP